MPRRPVEEIQVEMPESTWLGPSRRDREERFHRLASVCRKCSVSSFNEVRPQKK